MQSFEWQYQDEKILFKKHESVASTISRTVPMVIGFLILWCIFSTVVYYISKSVSYTWISIGIFWCILCVYLFFVIKFHRETFFVFTDKRAVKSVRNWLFAHHLKELKIENIKQTTSNNMWILWKIFGYWNINVQWPDKETSLYFRNIPENKAIVLYISRMIDFIKKACDNAELWEFKSNFKNTHVSPNAVKK